jgi:predicted glutamine amidotransferase
VGLRYGRSLWYVERDLVHLCEVCDGALHGEEGGTSPYRAVVVASQRVTGDEEWTQVPEASLFHVDTAARFRSESL